MKINKLTIFLVIIILLLGGYIIYDKCQDDVNIDTDKNDDLKVAIIENIHLDYLDIYLTNEGIGYLVPIKLEDIEKLDEHDNLKDRLTTLYNRSFYYDIYVNGYKIKGFKVELDCEIKKIRLLKKDDLEYVVFIKENGQIALFSYLDYYDLLKTKVMDNYLNLQNIVDVKDNKLVYEDGHKEELKIK